MMMKWIKAYAAGQNKTAKESDTRLREVAAATEAALLEQLGTGPDGLTEEQAEAVRERTGPNRLARARRKSAPRRLLEAFADPFSLVLLLLAVVSLFTDVVLADPAERSYMTVAIITVMVAVSGVLRFVQETRSGNVAQQLTAMIHTTACFQREGKQQERPMEEIVVGGHHPPVGRGYDPRRPADPQRPGPLLSQATLTGESEPVEKSGDPCTDSSLPLTGVPCLAFQGSNVVSGSARAVAVAVGGDTLFGGIARHPGRQAPQDRFRQGHRLGLPAADPLYGGDGTGGAGAQRLHPRAAGWRPCSSPSRWRWASPLRCCP